MPYTLGEAAKRPGLSKPTVQRAIKNGKLSALRNDDGSYSIDPADLERVYGTLLLASDMKRDMKQDDTPVLSEALQVEVAALRERLADKDNVIDDLRRRLDAEGEERRKLTAILTDQRTKETVAAPTQTEAAGEQPRGLRGWLHRVTR